LHGDRQGSLARRQVGMSMQELALSILGGRGPLLPLAAFIGVGVAVFLVASRLARHADAVADATGLGRLWVGSVLLAASTSLPELTTDVNAAILDTVDIGVGDLMGSTLANMMLLALLDLFYRRRRILDNASSNHALVATLAVVLTATVGAAIVSGGWGRIGHVGIETILIVAIYLVGMRSVYANMTQTAPPDQLELGETNRTVLRRGLLGFAAAAVGLLVTAPLLVLSAEVFAAESGLSESFVGTLLVGFTTSFPEIAACIAAVRLGALDLAVGNIFGSNAFNMTILLAMDVAYTKGPVLAAASPDHARTALFAVFAVGFGLTAILARRGTRLLSLRVESLAILLSYGGAVWFLAS
jgi:cation:H+ antiporter